MYKCSHCNYPNEDNSLELIVKDGVERRFKIKEDGTLYDEISDGTGQEIYLECPVCGTRYEFINYNIILEDAFRLAKCDDRSMSIKPLEKEDYEIKEIRR